MKLIAVSDIHSDEYAADRIRVKVSKSPYDYCIIAGDLTNVGPVSFVEQLLEFLPKTFAIHGNMDSLEIERLLVEKGISIHGRKAPLKDGLSIAGFGGSNPTPFNTPTEYSEEEIYSGLSSLKLDPKTILVSHAPPFNCLDEVSAGMHVGSKAVRRIIEEQQPLLCICGHIHESEGVEKIGNTVVVKLGAAERERFAEITIEKGKVEAKNGRL